VRWPHLGYLRLAIARGLEVVPVAASGVDDAFFGLVDHDGIKRLLRLDNGHNFWVGLGPLGPYPWSPPFPVRVHQIVGAPVVPVFEPAERKILLDDPERLSALHESVQNRVQELLELARSRVRRRQRLSSWTPSKLRNHLRR
jgi:hypothetical protein